MAYPEAYIAYLVQFHASRDYFECHELLEEYWKEHPDDAQSDTWVGLIQLAVGQYHERRGNRRGAAKMYEGAYSRLLKADLGSLGLDHRQALEQLQARRDAVKCGCSAYSDINLVMTDESLENTCRSMCRELGLVWRAASSLDDDNIVHRHARRDRSDVVAAREAALKRKGRSGL